MKPTRSYSVKTFRIEVPFWYYEAFEVKAESEEEAIELLLEDSGKYSVGEETQMGILEDVDMIVRR